MGDKVDGGEWGRTGPRTGLDRGGNEIEREERGRTRWKRGRTRWEWDQTRGQIGGRMGWLDRGVRTRGWTKGGRMGVGQGGGSEEVVGNFFPSLTLVC